MIKIKNHHILGCKYHIKSVRIRSYSGPYFPAFGLNMERYGVSLHIKSKCGKLRIRITPNTDTFHVVNNLYGWAMSQNLPVNNFEWIEDTSQFNEDFIKNCKEESDIGYFLKVND